jgi:hypothetical protein
VSSDEESISVVLVAITRVKDTLRQCDGAGLQTFKQALLSTVRERFDRYFTERLFSFESGTHTLSDWHRHYLLATVLNARFKNRPFSDKKGTYELALRWLAQEMSPMESESE